MIFLHCIACSIEIEVEYYEQEKEIMTKVESVVVIARDAPLREVFMKTEALSKVRTCSCQIAS